MESRGGIRTQREELPVRHPLIITITYDSQERRDGESDYPMLPVCHYPFLGGLDDDRSNLPAEQVDGRFFGSVRCDTK